MKYLRLIFTDISFILKWVLLMVIGGIILFQNKTLTHQQDRMAQIKYEKDELQRLASIRQNYMPKEEPLQIVSDAVRKQYVLEGSSRQKESFHALINGKVYTPGDPIDEFIVSGITLDSAVLVHQKTGETKILQFLGPKIVQN
ncbi:MAG: hypothetical protein AB7S78_13865 [Candidatus Omnitrophota bacterium]